MKIVHLSSEGRPWASSGGLAEVTSALSAAQHRNGDDVWLWLPAYRDAKAAVAAAGWRLRDTGVAGVVALPVGRWRWRALVAEPAAQTDGVDSSGRRVGFIDCPDFFDRDGLYHGADHRAFGDNALRFAVFVRAAMAAAPELLGGAPDILHAHDWQTALAPYWLATERPSAWRGCRSVFTIHNLGYPGRFPVRAAYELGLPSHDFNPGGLEFFGDLMLMKAGIVWADAVTTVSPTYAKEICTPAYAGGLDGLLRRHRGKLLGVLNGIDDTWNPATDPHLAAPYDATNLTGKATCRSALLSEVGLQATATQPVLASISRFAWQKGLDLLAEVATDVIAADARLIVLGGGDPALEHRFSRLAARYPRHIAVHIGYDQGLSHRIEAGADAFVMPSRYEPCGLNQLYSMAYGTPPIVHSTGGLADTVVHASPDALRRKVATGVVFDDADPQGLRWAIEEAVRLFRHQPAAWRAMQQAGMARDPSWTVSAKRYREIYWGLHGRHPGPEAQAAQSASPQSASPNSPGRKSPDRKSPGRKSPGRKSAKASLPGAGLAPPSAKPTSP